MIVFIVVFYFPVKHMDIFICFTLTYRIRISQYANYVRFHTVRRAQVFAVQRLCLIYKGGAAAGVIPRWSSESSGDQRPGQGTRPCRWALPGIRYWGPSCYHGSVGMDGMLSRSIFQHIIRMNIIDSNPKITIYWPGIFIRGIQVTAR